MKLGFPKETHPDETRSSATPKSIEKLVKAGFDVSVESGIGIRSNISDQELKDAGAEITTRESVFQNSDMILRLRKPDQQELSSFKKGAIHVSFLDPFNEKNLIQEFKNQNITSISMEMIPRSTFAQKMDALSSQANLAGYVAVIIATEKLKKILPMMTTPAGTISPGRVFVIGAGVAGLQAIATAKRLGARVEAFDTRAVVEEQVQSLGAKFVKVDLGETGQTKDGYAKALTEEQIQKQRDAMAKVCSYSDIVITTAQLFGRKAPVIITEDMIKGMKSGSVIVDLAVETGGNVEGSKVNETVDINGVQIVGLANLPGRVAETASQMYASNLVNFLTTFWDKDEKKFNLDLEHEILQGCVITHNGEIVNETIKNLK